MPAPHAGGWEERHTLILGGRTRQYRLYVPSAQGQPRPLVVVLHGHGDRVPRLRRRAGLETAARARQFLVAYPMGTGWLGLPPRGWNAGNCCGYARQRRIDDVAFLRALVQDVGRRHAVDRARVYAAGVSNGAMMAHRLACEAADTFAAVASVAGTLGVAHCQPAAPVSILEIHGTADRLVPYDGGTPLRPGQPPRVDWPVAAVMRSWAARQACQAVHEKQPAARLHATVYEACAGAVRVQLDTWEGGGHAWPQTAEFSATQELLMFFNLEPPS